MRHDIRTTKAFRDDVLSFAHTQEKTVSGLVTDILADLSIDAPDELPAPAEPQQVALRLNVREELWLAGQRRARAEGVSLSELLRRRLEERMGEYVR